MIYYSTNLQGLTTATSETDHMRFLTGTTRTANIIEIMASCRGAVVGGGTVRLRRFGTPSTVGTVVVPSPEDPGGQAATITADTTPTAGSTPTQVASIGFSQTGAQGFWGAPEPNGGKLLNASGAAGGNMDFISISNAASPAAGFDLTVRHIE